MKTLTFKNFKRNILILLTALLILSSVGFTFSFGGAAYADDVAPTAELFLPSTDMEYKALQSPVDTFSNDTLTAVIQNTDPNTLLVYYAGQYSEISATQLTGVNLLNDDTLIFSSAAKLRKVDLSTYDPQNPEYVDLPIYYYQSEAVRYFDLNSQYLVTAYELGLGVFTITQNQISEKTTEPIKISSNSHVAINDNNDIFYVYQNQLCKINADNLSSNAVVLAEVNPTSKIIANNDYVFYIHENKIYRLSVNGGTPVELKVLTENYAIKSDGLGNLLAPSGLTFKNGNLFITDSTLNAVQEFKIENDKLVFTGFAIASGKTAYNRVSKNAVDVEKYGDTVAVLDEYKLTVYSPVNANKYARENYKNYIKNDFAPLLQYFALGNGKILYSTTNSEIELFNFNDENQTATQISLPISVVLIDDVCYQSGKFYVLVHTNTSSIVYSIGENDELLQAKEIVNFNDNNTYRAVTVDVFGNVYLADTTGKIVLCDKENSYAATNLGTKSGVIKLETDLGGNLFVLAADGISVYDGTAFNAINLDPVTDGDKIKSFTMNFDKTEIQLLYENKEYVCKCSTLGNYALDKATATDTEYVISANTTDLNKLKSATVKAGANVYSVNRSGTNFKFKGLISPEAEYAVICEVKLSDDLILSALAGVNGVVLVNNDELTVTAPTTTEAPEKAFVTTNSSLYYFPILTENGEYALTDGETVRINKSTMITPTAKLSFLGSEFYFASVTEGENTFSGYIPVSFTVEVLSEDFAWDEYKIEKINSTKLYADKELKTEIKNLSKNEKIRVFSTENGISKVAVKVDDGSWIEGYIKSSAIQNEPNRAVRNILIILAVTASVCGTLTYFLMRRKG